MIAEILQQQHDTPKIVNFTRTGIVIPEDYRRDVDATEQCTLRGRIVGIPALTWKHHRWGATSFAPWPIEGTKPYLMVRLATRRHGVLTLPLPPSAAEELKRLEAELDQPITDIDLVVSMVDRGNYFYATFAEAKRRAA
ncbi:MAG: hypothetical protein AAF682_00140 [Planctomycetota bacterium]